MKRIWLTSDLHFDHNRQFVFAPRGFASIEEMNTTVVSNINSLVAEDDTLYIVGDIMVGGTDNTSGMELLNSIKCKDIHIIRGNHDTKTRLPLYSQCPNVTSVLPADFLDYNHYHFFISHFPALTGSLENGNLKQMTCNLFAHTHNKDKFFEDRPYMYNVALDAHDNKPILLDEAIADMEAKVKECMEYL